MNTIILEKLFSISLKARILRTWQKASRADEQEFSELELFALELVSDFGPITEKGLCKIFGLSFSSVSDIVKKLRDKSLIECADKNRGKPLTLTKEGKTKLEEIKRSSATRFSYLFESPDTLTEEEWRVLMKLLEKMDKNAERHIQRFIFDRYSPLEK